MTGTAAFPAALDGVADLPSTAEIMATEDRWQLATYAKLPMVLVSGCHPGDCHYINGNFKARRRIKLLQEILPQFGFAPERLKLTWIGASDGIQFADTITQLVARLKALGPSEARSQMVI